MRTPATAARIALGVALCIPVLAHAHPGHSGDSSFAAAFLHPLTGIDHLLALLATGLLAGRMPARGAAVIVITFLTLLATGAAMGAAAIGLAGTEVMILVSILALGGLALKPPRRLPVATASLAGVFALFHGHAHGAEVLTGGSPFPGIVGLVLSSALIIGIAATVSARLDRRAAATTAPRILR